MLKEAISNYYTTSLHYIEMLSKTNYNGNFYLMAFIFANGKVLIKNMHS